MRLHEAFNFTYPVERLNSDMYMFETEAGNTYQIYFETDHDPNDGYVAEVIFNLIDPNTMLPHRKFETEFDIKKDNPMKIFSTVAKVTKEFVSKEQPDIFAFSGKGQLASVYERMMGKIFSQSTFPNYSMSIKRGSSSTYFIFDKI